MIEVACNSCGSRTSEILFQAEDRLHGTPGVFRVVRCSDCGLVFLNPRPADDELMSLYPDDYQPYSRGNAILAGIKQRLFDIEAGRINRNFQTPGRMLEIGCGAGEFLARMRDRFGWEVLGLDPGIGAARNAAEVFGLQVKQGFLNPEDFEPESFDLIVMRHVIEHVPDPMTEMRNVVSLLKQGGCFFVATPNFESIERRLFGARWYDLDTPRHLTLFAPATLRKMLLTAGFSSCQFGFSPVPNGIIGSLRHLADEHLHNRLITRFFDYRNILLVLTFLPVTACFSLFRTSGRFDILARKK